MTHRMAMNGTMLRANPRPGAAFRRLAMAPASMLAALLLAASPGAGAQDPETCVVLLHGLGRTPLSMLPMKFGLDLAGYRTVNQGYASLLHPVETLAGDHIPEALEKCASAPDAPVHFVAHSLGGILVRHYLQDREIPSGSRMVMLGPPNKGSELIDELAGKAWFSVMGPAALQLGTDDDSVPRNLGPVDIEIGIIAGTRTGLDYILQQAAPIPGPNDGKVSIDSARLDGMKDFLTVDESHTFMLNDPSVISQVIAFLETGRFRPEDDEGSEE